MSKQKTILKKINEIKKLKKLFQKVCNLLNDPIEMKDTALRNEAYHEACSNIQERMLNRSKQCLGFSSRPLLHRNSSAIDEQRERIGDGELREAEKIYRRKDPAYAKDVDRQHAEITNLLIEIEKCRYFLQDTFQAYSWIKGTLLAGDFEYFRKCYKDLNKPWFVGEISEILEKLDKIQYALEREQQPEIQQDDPDKAAENIEIDSLTKEQQWRDDAPRYIPNAIAVKMANGKIYLPGLSKLLRKQGNFIRWMRNKQTRRAKVHMNDFLRYIKSVESRNVKSPDDFSEAVFEQRERQAEIDQNKKTFG